MLGSDNINLLEGSDPVHYISGVRSYEL